MVRDGCRSDAAERHDVATGHLRARRYLLENPQAGFVRQRLGYLLYLLPFQGFSRFPRASTASRAEGLPRDYTEN